ncbi:MAG: hypothetical protein U1F49_04000 [Rubrivivax sp.]
MSAGETGSPRKWRSRRVAETTPDAYLLALTTATLLQDGKSNAASAQAGRAAAARLAKMQGTDGGWTQADHSITKSGGTNLSIETTSLAVMALLKADGHSRATQGCRLAAEQPRFRQWGATQATVLALKAVMRFDEATRVAPRAGAVTLLVDGVPVAEQAFEAGRREPLVFTGFDEKLLPGKHRIINAAVSEGRRAAALFDCRRVPQRRADQLRQGGAVQLAATLAKADVKMGETVRMDAVVSPTRPSAACR